MKKFAKLAAAAAIAGLAFASNAALVIDDFSQAQGRIQDDNGSDLVGAHSEQAGSGIIGGYRDLFIIKTSPADAADDSLVSIRVSGSKLIFEEGSGAKAVGVIRWDGQNAGGVNASNFLGSLKHTGLGAQNLLAAGSAFHLSVTAADAAFPFQLAVYTDAANFSILELTSTGPGEYTIPFAAFALGHNVGSGANFASVGALEAYINLDTSTTAFLGKAASIDLSVEIVDIPEPGTMALAGLALVGLGAIRRRKQAV